ncbi:MAG: hypothetical protein AAGD04_13130 [Pseudomonadota bacterium]
MGSLFALFGSMMIAIIIGYFSEKSGFTRNGVLPSIIICLGGVIAFFMVRVMFHLSFGSPGLDAIISAIGALIIVPTHYRKR